MKRKVIISAIIILIFLSVIAYGAYYVNDYYHADKSVDDYLNGTDNVAVKYVDKGLLLDGPGNDSAMIFYPGAKIEYTSYIPLLLNISDNGIDCFIIEMPFNLAVLGSDSADNIIDNYNYSHYYMAGHSLGGSMASSYANKNSQKVDALVLLASYPTEKIENLSVLSIYGSEDKILNKKNYEESLEYMPENFTEYVIIGGNHAQFASYNNQSGDGTATISSEEQKKQTVNEILHFINQKTF